MKKLLFLMAILCSIAVADNHRSGLALLEDENLFLDLAVTNPVKFREKVNELPPGFSLREYYLMLGIPENRVDMMLRLRNQLIQNEGYLPRFYKDTKGLVTVGVGHLIETGDPVNKNTIEILLLEDTIVHAKEGIEWLGEKYFIKLNEVRKRVVIDLSFNMGSRVLHQFKNTRQAIRDGRYTDAANGLRNSRWCKQVKTRCDRITYMMRTGKDPQGIDYNIDKSHLYK